MREQNIENEILKQNKIPGCDQLTRPEEIKALSKYLKSIRKVQENHTTLEKNNLELPGRTTGRIPEINSLEDHVEGLDGVRGVKNLYKESSRISLGEDYKEKSPLELYTEKSREDLEDKRKISLENKREGLEGIPNPDDTKLEKHREGLDTESSEIEELGRERLELENVRGVRNLYINIKEKLNVPEEDIKLGKTKESLIDNHNPELDLTRIDLEGFRDLSYKEQLEVDSRNELDTTKINIGRTPGDIELGTYREDLITPEELEKLGNYRESLRTEDPLEELGTTKIKLNGIPESELSELPEDKIPLRKTAEDQELGTYKEKLRTPEELDELGNHQEKLRDTREELDDLPEDKIALRQTAEELEELGNTRIDLGITEENELKSLEDYRDPLVVEDDNSLGDTRIDLGGTEDYEPTELEDYQEILEGTKEAEPGSLEDTRIDLEGTVEYEATELEDYRDPLVVEDDNSLGDTRIDLGGTEDYEPTELEDYQEILEGTKEAEPGSLEDTRIDLEGTVEYEATELEDYRDPLVVEDNNFLEDERIDLEGTKEAEPESLEDTRIDLEGTKDFEMSELEDYREDLSVEDNNFLEDERIDLEGTEEAEMSELEDTRIDLEGTVEYEATELEDTRIDLEGTKEAEPSSLEDERIDLEGTKEAEPESLEDFIDKLEDSRDPELEDERIDLPEAFGDGFEGYNPLGPEELESLGGDINNFYESILEVPEAGDAPRQDGDYNPLGPEELDSLGGGLENFYDSILGVPEDTEENHTIEELSDVSIEIPEDTEENHTVEELSDVSIEIPEDTEENHTVTELDDTKHKAPNAQAPSGQDDYEYSRNQKLSKELVDGLAYKDHETSGKTIRSKAEDGDNGGLTLGDWLEGILGFDKGDPEGKHGKERQKELNACLRNLTAERDAVEMIKGTWRSRLPGNNSGIVGDLVSGGIGGMVDGVVDNVVDSAKENIGNAIFGDSFMDIDISKPLNRPDGLLDKGMDAVEGIFGRNDKDGWTAANNRITSSMPNSANIYATSKFSEAEKELHTRKVNGKSSSGGGFWDKVGDVVGDIVEDTLLGKGSDYKLKANYLTGKGIETTLEELCGKSVSEVSSIGDLYTILQQSPYLTTPDKFTSANYSGYRSQTLDTNSFWEVVLEPYAGPENGDLNYLPGIHEINIRNIVTHGVNTAYNKWIPFTGFDLQKSKVTSKTLSLYDGEISYPISMEFTNELRITIADDQYKSWRRYFEECAKAAIYNSEGHDYAYYLYPRNDKSDYTLTAIDTNNICIAMYKNICFRCLIYISTPQFSNIQKFDLLVVMKDFSEEYTGDVDGGAGDLTVSFSIVGENPVGVESITRKFLAANVASYEKKKTSSDYTSILSGGINAVGSLIK